ncbi:MAG: hypothetical protein JW929_09955 [Anaerolineales bacterium]|nr:hypothetical protein [Anaerolineales bacterium]
MRTKLVLKPGSRGTRKLLAEYGKRLVCVRYRYDWRLGRRWKTVELIIHEASWKPKPSSLVYVRIQNLEWTKQEKMLESGARWDKRRLIWRMRYENACRLGLADNIIEF